MEKKMTELTNQELIDGAKGRWWLNKAAVCEAELLRRLGAAVSQPTQEQVTAFFLETHGADLQEDMWNGQNMVIFALGVCKKFFAPAPAQEPPKEVMPTARIGRLSQTDSISASVASLKTSGLAAQSVENSSRCKWCDKAIKPCDFTTVAARDCKGFIHADKSGHYCCQTSTSFHEAEPISSGASTGEQPPRDPSRCSLDGASRIPLDREKTKFGACTLIGCKDPIHDYNLEQAASRPSEPSAPQVEDDLLEEIDDYYSRIVCDEAGGKITSAYERKLDIAKLIRKHLPGAPAQPGPEEKR